MKIKTQITFLLLPFLLLLQACGGDKGSTVLKALEAPTPGFNLFWGSCESLPEESVAKEALADRFSPKDLHTCREWYGDFFATINIKQACSSIENGSLSEAYCNQDNIVGLCVLPISIDSETRIYYDKEKWTKFKAKNHCQKQDQNAQWLDL